MLGFFAVHKCDDGFDLTVKNKINCSSSLKNLITNPITIILFTHNQSRTFYISAFLLLL
jgi:hypothetical protein